MVSDDNPVVRSTRREVLQGARAQALGDITSLRHNVAAIMEASTASNADDEHDPEGATIAFERAQAAALLDRATARLTEIDEALERVDAGTYGLCRSCGRQIPAARLAVRPAAARCLDCAR